MQAADSERWSSARSLLDLVLDEPDPKTVAEARTTAANEGCTTEFEALLAALDTHSALDAPLDASVREMAAPRMAEGALKGRVFDRWTLGDEIGRGGMSVVYHASRTGDGFEQQAALKILSLSFASPAMIDGFLRERRILSELQHPGIARLIDGGLTPEGSPYLVMEYVDGRRVDDWCREHDADARTVVRMIEQLSRAVAYAQRHLVIHRDINAANVLVNDRGRPVLIDFGIAGLMGSGAQQTMHAFTPTFAAPEQVAGERSTTATDVYAIGRLLESLLPEGGADRDLRLLIDVATADDPEQRYANARNLADDLQAWLDRRPMRARPPSLRYRAGRFVARHRVATAATALLLLSIVAGVVASVWQARIAEHERDLARAESARAHQVTVFLKNLFRASDPDRAQGETATARELLDQGAHDVRSAFRDSPGLRAEMLVLLGDLYRELGEIDAAEPLLREGLALARDIDDDELRVEALRALAHARMEAGEHEEALALVEDAEAMLRASGRVPGARHAGLMHAKLFSLSELGRTAEATEAGKTALAAARRAPDLADTTLYQYLYATANALQIAEAADEAEPLLLEAAAMELGDARDVSSMITLQSTLAGMYSRRGDLTTSLEHQRRAVELADTIYPPGHAMQARQLSNLGSVLQRLGHHDEALAALRRTLEIYDGLYGDEAQPRVAAALNNLSRALQEQGRYAEAEPYMVRSHAMAAELFGSMDPRYVIAAGNLGDMKRRVGKFDEAEALLTDSLELRRELVGTEHRVYGAGMGLLAALRLDQGRHEDALRLADDTLSLYGRIGFDNVQYLVVMNNRRAQALAGLGRHEAARSVFEAALALGEAASEDAGSTWPDLLNAYASFLVDRDDPAAAAMAARALEANVAFHGQDHPESDRARTLVARIGPESPLIGSP